MLVSLDWLKDFVDIPEDIDPNDLGNELTLKTAEVEKVVSEGERLKGVVVGHVMELKKHPNADRLKVAKVSTGKNTYQIVCGGDNLEEGQYIAYAPVGTMLKWHGEGDLVELKAAKIRGIESEGMICAANEIDLHELQGGPESILDLSAMKPNVGQPLAELLGKGDVILEFDNKSLTHRPDLWGHYGIAREVAAVIGKKMKHLEPKVKIPSSGESVKVDIEDYDLCPRYCGLIIDGVKVGESPEWMKRRLTATGHGVHNNIVDVTNYVMHELGQPMHAFDKDYIKGGIVVRLAKGGEQITTLAGKKGTLSPNMLVIADHEKPVAIAGVMGGENSEINDDTTSIILESANFNAASIRRTSTKTGVRTDAVQHFEKSLDPYLAELAIKRAAELILEMCPGAKIAGPITDNKKFNEKPLVIDLSVDKTRSKIGVDIDEKDIKKILESLEFGVKEKSKGVLSVTVPSYRATKDIEIDADLIEEVARLYGYENIPEELPHLPTRLPIENTERFKKHRVRELLSYGLGFDEVYNYSFYGESDLKRCLMTDDGHLKLKNYLSEDQTHMRISLIPNLMENIETNIKNFSEFKLYEIGRTYKDLDGYFPLEEKWIGGAVVKKGKGDSVFYEAKGAVTAILAKFGVAAKEANEVENTPYAHSVKAMTYLGENGQTLAKVFMLHPTVVKNYDLSKYTIAIFELNFSELAKIEKGVRMYAPIPKYPSVEIDVSVVMDRTTPAAEIEKVVREASELVKEVSLFDIYEGEGIEEGKRAVAYKILLQAEDRTLTNEEMVEVQGKVFKGLEKMGGVIRR